MCPVRCVTYVSARSNNLENNKRKTRYVESTSVYAAALSQFGTIHTKPIRVVNTSIAGKTCCPAPTGRRYVLLARIAHKARPRAR